MKNLVSLCLIFFLGSLFSQEKLDDVLNKWNKNSVRYITVDSLKNILPTVVLLDAREKIEYKVSHLKNANFVGYDNFNLEYVIKKFPKKDTSIVVYCSLGVRSELIAEKIKKAGYSNVYNLYGGIFEWKNKENEVVDNKEKTTEKVHTFNKEWSKWLKKGKKVYDQK